MLLFRTSNPAMSLQQTFSPTPLNAAINEIHWVIQIRRYLEEDDEDETGIPVCIFSVPKSLISTKPESYIPQEVALGPYHQWRPELYEMERHKISAAKRTQKRLRIIEFQNLVDRLLKLEPRIRSCYHRYLDYSGETLAWMMAVDASFLLEFLQIFKAKDGKVVERISTRMSHLVDYSGRRSTHNAILRDIMMLENQIPLFLLRRILRWQSSSAQEADEELTKILSGLCKELFPFKKNKLQRFPNMALSEHAHLLKLLQSVLVPKSYQQPNDENVFNDQEVTIEVNLEESSCNDGYVRDLLNTIWGWMLSLNARMFRPVMFVVKLPWTIITKLPFFSPLKQLMDYFFASHDKEEAKKEGGSNPNNNANQSPSIEEIRIPSVSELIKVGVEFAPTNGDISTIKFDEKTVTVYLPTVTLDVNTEVILRNLVAFEASMGSGPLVFTWYTELMNGIVDTEQDVKLLRDRQIISNCLKSDEEAASLWNGMSRSVRLTKVSSLDKVIEDVNKYYSGRCKVRAGKYMKRFVFRSWRFLTFVAAILLLLLNSLQSFCSVCSCTRWFNVKAMV